MPAADFTPKRILFIRGGALGDLIVTLPTVAAIRRHWPQAKVELLGYPRLGEIGKKRGYFDAVHSVDSGPLAGFFVPKSVLDPDWMDLFASFDLVISYFFDPDNLFAENLKRCGVQRMLHGSPKVSTAPAAAHFAKPLAELGVSVSSLSPKLTSTTEDIAAADLFLHGLAATRPLIAIHPGSGGEPKNWPITNWQTWLKTHTPDDCLRWLVISGESDDARVDHLLKTWSGPPPLRANRLALPHLAAILARCAYFVGHDSGVTHLAAASGCPVLALFGPTDPDIWAPPGKHVTVLKMGHSMEALTIKAVDKVFRQRLRMIL